MDGASIALGVDGTVTNTLTAYQLAPGTTTRVAQLATATADAAGVAQFDLMERIYGHDGGPEFWWWWFDVPLAVTFEAGNRYELVFSDFTLTSGTPVYPNNWIYGHALYDDEGRAYGQPYNVCDLLTVVDGSLRGSVPPSFP